MTLITGAVLPLVSMLSNEPNQARPVDGSEVSARFESHTSNARVLSVGVSRVSLA